jgi:hypothetical protein
MAFPRPKPNTVSTPLSADRRSLTYPDGDARYGMCYLMAIDRL